MIQSSSVFAHFCVLDIAMHCSDLELRHKTKKTPKIVDFQRPNVI